MTSGDLTRYKIDATRRVFGVFPEIVIEVLSTSLAQVIDPTVPTT